jgi:erythromycin esterase
MRRLIAFAGLFLSLSAHPQSLENRMAGHAAVLENDSDFAALDDALRDKRIVIIGEAGHWDGTTFAIRAKLTQHLIDNLGFDAIGFETSGFLESQMLPGLTEELFDIKFDMARFGQASLWNNTTECRQIMDAINRGEIPFFGFDRDYYYPPYLIELLLKELYPEYAFDRKKFEELYNRIIDWNDDRTMASEEDIYMDKTLREIANLCVSRPAADEYKRDLLRQGVKNIRWMPYADSKIKRDPTLEIPDDHHLLWHANNLRDAMMADNIEWYLERNPDKKVVIWCANFHGARDISQVEYPKLPGYYMRLKLMGEYLSDKYGDQLYSLAFASWRMEPDDLEAVLAERGVDYGFLDFTPLRKNTEFTAEPFKSSVIGYKSGYWMNVFDGIYFHKKQEPPTPIIVIAE